MEIVLIQMTNPLSSFRVLHQLNWIAELIIELETSLNRNDLNDLVGELNRKNFYRNLSFINKFESSSFIFVHTPFTVRRWILFGFFSFFELI